jgi:hypothetical protein
MDHFILSTGLATLLAQVSLGGGIFEYRVLDPSWPGNPALIQPLRGGVNRKAFWIYAHVAFELSLLVALLMTWHTPQVRDWLLIALVSHVVMRLWSAVDFIPKALAFEKADVAAISAADARRWTRRSLWRMPLALVTTLSTLVGFAVACRIGRL